MHRHISLGVCLNGFISTVRFSISNKIAPISRLLGRVGAINTVHGVNLVCAPEDRKAADMYCTLCSFTLGVIIRYLVNRR